MTIGKKVVVQEKKKLYIELMPGKDRMVLKAGVDLKGTIVFNLPDDLPEGNYALVEGCDNIDLKKVEVNGLKGKSYTFKLVVGEGENAPAILTLIVEGQRGAADGVLWTGAESAVWDYQTKNFSLNGQPTAFVEGDKVVFDDSAEKTTITINEMMPADAVFKNNKSYTLNGVGGISGRIILESGKLTVKELNYNFEIGKATLAVNNTNASCENPILLTDAATISIASGTTSLKGKITGEGSLLKTGAGQLNITYAGANAWTETILQAGTLAMGTWNTTFGKSTSPIHVTGNAAITVFNNNSTSQMPQFQNPVTIDKGKTLTFHAGQRCAIKGKLLGEGTYKIDFPYVRGDVYTNCSQFEGTYHVTTTNCRFVQAMDLSKATLRIDKDAEVVSVKAGSGTAQSLTHKVGNLTGEGTLGNGTWNVSGITYSTGSTIITGTLKLNSPLIDVTALTRGTVPDNAEFKILTINGTASITGTPTFFPATPKDGWEWDTSTLTTDGVLRMKLSTAIDAVENDNAAESSVYTVTGVKLPSKTSVPKGKIMIMNGKKILK